MRRILPTQHTSRVILSSKPSDHLAHKLDPDWLGPYEVVAHVKNDVECRHLVLCTVHKLHVTRLKPFFGTREEAIRIAKLDQNQFTIQEIKWYTGNPHVRTSMIFTILFEDGQADVPYNPDLAATQQFVEYVHSRADCFPLRFSAAEAKKQVAAMNKLAITNISPGDTLYLSLRYFDGTDRMWVDSLGLPDIEKYYVVEIQAERYTDSKHRAIWSFCTTFDARLKLTGYDIFAHCLQEFNADSMVLVTAATATTWPQIFK